MRRKLLSRIYNVLYFLNCEVRISLITRVNFDLPSKFNDETNVKDDGCNRPRTGIIYKLTRKLN